MLRGENRQQKTLQQQENRSTRHTLCCPGAFRKRCNLETEERQVGQDTTEIIEFETAFKASSVRETSLGAFHVAVRCSISAEQITRTTTLFLMCFPSFQLHTILLALEQGMPRQPRICLGRTDTTLPYQQPSSSPSSSRPYVPQISSIRIVGYTRNLTFSNRVPGSHHLSSRLTRSTIVLLALECGNPKFYPRHIPLHSTVSHSYLKNSSGCKGSSSHVPGQSSFGIT